MNTPRNSFHSYFYKVIVIAGSSPDDMSDITWPLILDQMLVQSLWSMNIIALNMGFQHDLVSGYFILKFLIYQT